MIKRVLAIIALVSVVLTMTAQDGRFCIVKDGRAATIVVDENDWK